MHLFAHCVSAAHPRWRAAAGRTARAGHPARPMGSAAAAPSACKFPFTAQSSEALGQSNTLALLRGPPHAQVLPNGGVLRNPELHSHLCGLHADRGRARLVHDLRHLHLSVPGSLPFTWPGSALRCLCCMFCAAVIPSLWRHLWLTVLYEGLCRVLVIRAFLWCVQGEDDCSCPCGRLLGPQTGRRRCLFHPLLKPDT